MFRQLPPRKEVLLGALPVAAAGGGGVLLTLLATAIIGRYSTESMAGVALGGAIFTALAALAVGAQGAHQVLVARRQGTGLRGAAWTISVRMALWGGLLLLVIAALSAITCVALLPFLDGANREAALYLIGRSLALPLSYVSGVGATFLYVRGKQKAPLWLLGVNAGVMLPVAVVLIYHFRLGAFGDGVAGSAAALVGAVFLWLLALRGRRSDVDDLGGGELYRSRFGEEPNPRFLRYAWPLMISNLLDQLGTVTIALLIANFSVAATAAFRVGVNLQSTLFLLVNAVSFACIAAFSMHLGASDMDRPEVRGQLKRIHTDGAIGAAAISSLLGAVFILVGTDDPLVRGALWVVVAVCLISVPVCAVTFYFVSEIRIRGLMAEDAKGNIAAVWLVLVPSAIAMALLFGPTAAVGAYVLYWGARAALARAALRRSQTQRVRSSSLSM